MKRLVFLASLLVLTACGGGGGSSANSNTSTTSPTATTDPIANAGTVQNVTVGSIVTLDGRNSTVQTGKTITYSWSLSSKPTASNVTLLNPLTVAPTLTPDVAGTYNINLVVNDGISSSAPSNVNIVASVLNIAPIANAGSAQSAVTGTAVSLDGSGSSGGNGGSLTYSWTFTLKPAGSAATLSSATVAKPTFTPDLPGNYIVSLTVNDGDMSSVPSSVAINVSQPLVTVPLKTVKIACGDNHSLVIRSDGSVNTLGRNDSGQLGDGTLLNKNVPVRVSGISNAAAVAGGRKHSLVLKNDGTVWGWGDNSIGQLGDGTQTNRLSPVQVFGLTNIAAIAANYNYSVALKNDGTVWLWGENYGSIPSKMGNFTNIISIAAGYTHTLALKNDGTVWGWGDNDSGGLGDGTISYRSTPVKAYGLTNVVSISAGFGSSFAVKNDGTAWSWGSKLTLGVNELLNVYTPIQISTLNNVKTIAAKYSHVLALGIDNSVIGSLSGWAYYNGFGQVGDGTIAVAHMEPVTVKNISNVTDIATGYSHSLALRSDGTIWGWGNSEYGQSGNFNGSNPVPIQIVNIP